MKNNNDIYHSDNTKPSASVLKRMLDNPAKVKYEQSNPKAKTPALLIGTMADTLMLEPEDFANKFIICKEGKETLKIEKETLRQFNIFEIGDTPIEKCKKPILLERIEKAYDDGNKLHKDVVTTAMYEEALAIAKKIRESTIYLDDVTITFEALLELKKTNPDDVLFENIMYGTVESTTGEVIPIRMKSDILAKLKLDNGSYRWFCIDIKTSKGNTHKDFSREYRTYNYNIQNCLYLHILSQNGINADFYYLVVGKEEWSECLTHKAPYLNMQDSNIGNEMELISCLTTQWKHGVDTDEWSERKFDYYKVSYVNSVDIWYNKSSANYITGREVTGEF